jgi:hypothetical protein
MSFFEKTARNVAQRILYQNRYNFFSVEISSLKLGLYCTVKKLPKVNNRPRGENSPNLVTLPHTL